MPKAKRFTVSAIDWAKKEDAADGYSRRTVRTTPVAALASFDEAEADRRAREAERHQTANPFEYGGPALFYQTSLDGPRLHDWLMDAGITPPAEVREHANWAAWWRVAAPEWTAEQRAHAWAAMDKLRFFAVSEAPTARKAYVIQELNWRWEDEPTLYADYEGGKAVRAYRSKKAAEKECARLNKERQAQPDHDGFEFFSRSTRGVGPEDPDSTGISETVFFEVVEIELEDGA